MAILGDEGLPHPPSVQEKKRDQTEPSGEAAAKSARSRPLGGTSPTGRCTRRNDAALNGGRPLGTGARTEPRAAITADDVDAAVGATIGAAVGADAAAGAAHDDMSGENAAGVD